MEALDHAGFIFDKHQLGSETLHSKIDEGITKMIPAEFKRKINFSEEIQYKKQMSNAYRQANNV